MRDGSVPTVTPSLPHLHGMHLPRLSGPMTAGSPAGENATTLNPGLTGLLQDLERLSEDRDSADLVFLVGKDETPIRGHRLIYAARCKHFSHACPSGSSVKRSPGASNSGTTVPPGGGSGPEVCQVRGWTVKNGSPTTIMVPHFSSEAFQMVHRFIYAGNVTLTEETVYEVMSLAQCIGLDQLHKWTEDHVASSLNPLNACSLLGAAVALEERTKGCISKASGEKSFVDTCVSYIGENASECVRTPSFRALSKDALTRLISSDQFALEEEEVWRAVLTWAKHQANVSSPTSSWTEDDRQRVRSFLTPVVQHVRLLLVDSQVFAEEVEPTGAVPMELILERYRMAALSGSGGLGSSGSNTAQTPVSSAGGASTTSGSAANGASGRYRHQHQHSGQGSTVGLGQQQRGSSSAPDPRFQPRAPPNRFFPGSRILATEDAGFQRLLNQWYGDPRENWTLVFRASEHNFSAQAFHRFCDGVAPTYVLILGPNGEVCGGFSDVPWGAPGGGTKTPTGSAPPAAPGAASGYCASANAFLFSLKNPHDVPPSKFPVVKRTFAIAQHPDIGPIFGAGADLCISDQCNINCESYSNLPHSYDGDNAFPGVLMGAYNFNIVDYEVFTPSQRAKAKQDVRENSYSNMDPPPVPPLPPNVK